MNWRAAKVTLQALVILDSLLDNIAYWSTFLQCLQDPTYSKSHQSSSFQEVCSATVQCKSITHRIVMEFNTETTIDWASTVLSYLCQFISGRKPYEIFFFFLFPKLWSFVISNFFSSNYINDIVPFEMAYMAQMSRLFWLDRFSLMQNDLCASLLDVHILTWNV